MVTVVTVDTGKQRYTGTCDVCSEFVGLIA